MNGTVTMETIESRVLDGNPLGDPTRRQAAVWLPPSYAAAPERYVKAPDPHARRFIESDRPLG